HRGRFDDGGAVMVRPLFGKVETLGPWTAYIQAMDQALQSNDPGESVRSWRQAYSAALSHPGWLGPPTLAHPPLPLGVFPARRRGPGARDVLDRVLPRPAAALAQRRPARGGSLRDAR